MVRVKRLHSKDNQKSANLANLEGDRTPCEVLLNPSYSPVIPASPKRSYTDLFSSSERTYTIASSTNKMRENADDLEASQYYKLTNLVIWFPSPMRNHVTNTEKLPRDNTEK